jgi:hypothetical protein
MPRRALILRARILARGSFPGWTEGEINALAKKDQIASA